MRPLEITLALALAVRIIFVRRVPRTVEYLPVLLALAQLFIEGYRWQLVPLYGITIGAGLISVRNLDPWKPGPSNGKRRAGAIGGVILLLLAAAPMWLLPIPNPPAPDGPFAVGTRTLHLVDASRTDPFAPTADTPRELMVQIWYPAAAEIDPGTDPAPWMQDAEVVAPAVAVWSGLPPFFLDHLIYAETDAYLNAPSAAGSPFPVILFSHGYGGFRAQNSGQAQELASHGYVVVAVEHTYASVLTVFPDGRQALHNDETLPEDRGEAAYLEGAHQMLDQWAADLSFMIDTLETMNADPASPFAGRLDMAHVGVMGHSTGGGAAVQVCAREPRCVAGLAMDAWLKPVAEDILAHGPAQPFMYMQSEAWRSEGNSERLQQLLVGSTGGTIWVSITGTDHFDFTDMPSLSPLAYQLGLKGPIDGKRIIELVNTYSLAFFDFHLKGQPSPLLDGPAAEYPEVLFP